MADLQRAQVGAGAATVAVGLGRFAGQVGRKWRGGAEFRSGRESRSGGQGHIDVFEDLAGRYAENAVGGFDQIVAFASGVLAAENVGEG